MQRFIILIVVVVVVVVWIILFAMGQLPLQSEETGQETPEAQEIRSLAGQVKTVDVANNSFVITDQETAQDVTVKIGSETEFIRLIFPFDPASPPEGIETFVPERETATIQGLETGDFIFVRFSQAIKAGEEVVDPLEIQILP